MGLVINTNVAAINVTRILSRSAQALDRSLERLSSGLRINRAADDAAGLAIAEGFRTQIRGAGMAQRNVQDGISLVQTAEGGLSEVTNILQRIRELAVQAVNGTLSDTNRADLQLEVDQLLKQILDISEDTEFNGIPMLFNGFPFNQPTTTITLQVGANPGQTLGIVFTAANPTTLGVNTVNVTTADLASTSIGLADDGLSTVNTLRADLGAIQNRLEFTINTLAIQAENSAASESSIRDANIALETIAFTRNQILVSAGVSILAQANLVPQTAIQLLGP